jgi:hypothetical protein
MNNRNFTKHFLIIALFSIVGFFITTCGSKDDFENKTFSFINHSSYTVIISDGIGVQPSSLTLEPGANKTATMTDREMSFSYGPANLVDHDRSFLPDYVFINIR